jgi:hypothetical protein
MLVSSAREVLSKAGRSVEVIGPLLEKEAEALLTEVF